MNFVKKITPFLQSPWFIALVLLIMFLSVTGYKYGWDDQHVEIPLLKNLIDHGLYQGDYYVESLKKNFSSCFYPLLAKFITVDQVPSAYFFLFLLSRYFLFFWMYKIWLHLSQDKIKAFCCILVIIFIGRIEEFLYRTFSHQEFALAFVFAGIYFFFKERFLLTALILGIATNFHALYSFFPMFYVGVYLLWHVKKHSFKTLVQSGAIYLFCAMPFIFWTVKNHINGYMGPPHEDWLDLYMLACPQNFLIPLVPFKHLIGNFGIFLTNTKMPLFLTILLTLNLSFNKDLRQNKTSLAFVFCAVGFLILAFKYTYLTPSRLALDLNLTRNAQFLLFLLMGYTTILIAKTIEKRGPAVGMLLGILFSLFKYIDFIASFAALLMLLLFMVMYWFDVKASSRGLRILKGGIIFLCLACSIPLIWGINYSFEHIPFRYFTLLTLGLITLLLVLLYFVCLFNQKSRHFLLLKKLFYLIPLVLYLGQYTIYHHERIQIEKTEGGYWLLQRNWEDMQHFVKENTPKDAMLLVPYNMEMGGFRIHSERKIVASYRDCGIIGFDLKAAEEWKRRIKDIQSYKVAMHQSPRNAIKNAILKYKADYIVFVRYAAPATSKGFLQKIYTNTSFVLFKVLPMPEFTHVK